MTSSQEPLGQFQPNLFCLIITLLFFQQKIRLLKMVIPYLWI